MKSKGLLTIALLGFVAVSVATLVFKETGAKGTTSATAEPSAPTTGAKLIAYYLHGKVRCVTCNDIEKTAKEAVEAGFAEDLKSGRIEWRAVNYEEPGNEHFATDFKLAAPCVVLSTLRDGRQTSWKSLPGSLGTHRRQAEVPLLHRGEHPRAVKRRHAGGRNLGGPGRGGRPPTRTIARSGSPGCSTSGPGGASRARRWPPSSKSSARRTGGGSTWSSSTSGKTRTRPQKYEVSTIPTQIFFDAEGKERFRHEGFFSREEILAKWRELGVELERPDRSDDGSPS